MATPKRKRQTISVEVKKAIIDAVFLLRQAWNQVTSTTISNCFRKVGFVFNELVNFGCLDL
jgi:hypothetical protein